MCINYMHSDRFLTIWETFFVQCRYAMLVLLRSMSSHNQTATDRSSPTASVASETVRDKVPKRKFRGALVFHSTQEGGAKQAEA